MTRIIYFVAASLDGRIAGPEGELDWLPPVDPAGEDDCGYRAFLDGVDAVVMGRRTYESCRRLPAWPYAGKPCWIMSRRAALGPLPRVLAEAALAVERFQRGADAVLETEQIILDRLSVDGVHSF